MNKVLYLGLNSSFSHSSLAYGYLRTFAEWKLGNCDWEWKLVEASIKDDEDKILQQLLFEKPDIITSTAYLFNFNVLLSVLKKYYQFYPKTKIVLGGPQFLGDNEKFLHSSQEIYAVIRGDESSFYKLLKNSNLSEVEGLCYIDTKYRSNETAHFAESLDNIPSLYEKGYFATDKPFCQLETSRGCLGKCSFCTSALTVVDSLSLGRVETDLQCIQKAGINEIRLIDRTFNEDSKRAIELLNLFINKFPDMKFHLEINPGKVNDKIMKIIKAAPKGKFHIEIGVQTFDDIVLKSVNRYALSKKVIPVLTELCTLRNIEVHTDLIAGLPEQTYDTVLQDIKLSIEITPEELQLENLKVLPGTPLANNASDIMFNKYPPYEILQTSSFTHQELFDMRILSKIIDGFYNIKELKQVFAFLVSKCDLLEEFLVFYKKNNSNYLDKPSLKNRFKILLKFSECNDNLYNLVKFAWCAAGLSAEHFGYKTQKVKEKFEADIIWENSKKLPAKRYFIALFPFNVGKIWNNHKAQIDNTEQEYIFYMALGNTLSHIAIKKLVATPN